MPPVVSNVNCAPNANLVIDFTAICITAEFIHLCILQETDMFVCANRSLLALLKSGITLQISVDSWTFDLKCAVTTVYVNQKHEMKTSALRNLL